MNNVREAIREIVKTTRFTTYQVIRVIEMVSKYDEKAIYKMTKKQKQIFNLLKNKLEDKENEE